MTFEISAGLLLVTLTREYNEVLFREYIFGVEYYTARDECIRCLNVTSIYFNRPGFALILQVNHSDEVDALEVGVGFCVVFCFIEDSQEICRSQTVVRAL